MRPFEADNVADMSPGCKYCIMKHSLLVSFLDGNLPAADFAAAIEHEVRACEEGVRSPANIGYIIITDGPLTKLTRAHARRLLECLMEGSLPWPSANYTGDCLIMSGDFEPEDEAVAEVIEFIADDSRAPTAGELRDALSALG